jgi:uncharacterized protein with PQ loop repeat
MGMWTRMSVPLLLDLGNILFFIGNLPQLYRTFQRRHELRDLSIASWMIHIFASVCFFFAGVLSGAWFSVALNGFHVAYSGVTAYWINRAYQ